MNHTRFLILFLGLLIPCIVHAQLDRVLLETYYVSDANDATDTTGSILPPHSTTYRIYVCMAKGCKLTRIFGNADHEFRIASDSVFYNHSVEGQTFANNFNVLRFNEGTVPLDTWLALGEVSNAKPGGKTYFGVPKKEDRDGSIIGGPNNDGGSKPVAGGLLVNNDPVAGIPLTTADGLDTMMKLPTGWINMGILDALGTDTTIFGSVKKGTLFSSRNMFLQNNGVQGVNPDSNQVLVAQLTTRGKLSYALNVEIVDSTGTIYDYVAQNGADSLQANLVQSFYLIYPRPCGCLNPNYMEYNPAFGCMDSSACKTLAVLGCMDTAACNYDPTANINVQAICCYPGYCNNRDISLVCPTLSIAELHTELSFILFPDPVQDVLNLKISGGESGDLKYEIWDAFARRVSYGVIPYGGSTQNTPVNVSALAPAIYLLRMYRGTGCSVKKFVKQY
ncbi:MAG TPA: hypothetical protein VNZ86_20910 [Bacteroidia bacterium]|nr:hypothetical protein [Bacteroidia bacterium]